MQLSITLGDNSGLLWKHTRKTKLRKNQRIEGDGAMQTYTASNQLKIHFLHGKGIDQVIGKLGIRLQV